MFSFAPNEIFCFAGGVSEQNVSLTFDQPKENCFLYISFTLSKVMIRPLVEVPQEANNSIYFIILPSFQKICCFSGSKPLDQSVHLSTVVHMMKTSVLNSF